MNKFFCAIVKKFLYINFGKKEIFLENSILYLKISSVRAEIPIIINTSLVKIGP